MNNKISWLLLEYDKTHDKSGLVTSGAFSEEFVEWAREKFMNLNDENFKRTNERLKTATALLIEARDVLLNNRDRHPDRPVVVAIDDWLKGE